MGQDFLAGPVQVSVPATSANLGPGFDSLGLALTMRDVLVGEVRDEGLEVVVDGAGAGGVPLDERHLVIRAMRAAFDAMGLSPGGLRLSCRNAVPHARGLGSSSAAIVGGVGLARALVADGDARLDDQALLDLAAGLEGHPDNVAPALLGGFVISGRDETGFYAIPSPVDPRVTAVALVPPEPVSTEVARGLLPATVPHADAAADAGRTALLVAALAGRPDQLWRGTRDYLHQDYRRSAMQASHDLVTVLRAEGLAAVVSGAGPTVLVLLDRDAGGAQDAVVARCPEGWQAHPLDIDADGLTVA